MSDWTAHLANMGKDPTMKTFLVKKAAELDEEDTPRRTTATSSKQPYTAPPRTYNPGRKPPRATVLYTREQGSCKLCNDANHVLFQCPELKSLSVDQRQSTAQRLQACINCLGTDHKTRSCLSKRSCRTCGKRHHTLLHRGEPPQQRAQYQQQQALACIPQPQQQGHLQQVMPPPTLNTVSTLVSTTNTVCNTATGTATILGTCVTTIEWQGRQHKARALMDNGSCLTFITSRMVSSLKMRKIAETTAVSGFQQTATPLSKHKVEFSIRNPSGNVTILIPVQAVVVDTFTGDLPSGTLTAVRQSPFLTGLPLADPKFDQPGRVDLLLGVNVLPRVMLEGRRHSVDYSMSATNSVYGWVVMGTCHSDTNTPRSHRLKWICRPRTSSPTSGRWRTCHPAQPSRQRRNWQH